MFRGLTFWGHSVGHSVTPTELAVSSLVMAETIAMLHDLVAYR